MTENAEPSQVDHDEGRICDGLREADNFCKIPGCPTPVPFTTLPPWNPGAPMPYCAEHQAQVVHVRGARGCDLAGYDCGCRNLELAMRSA